MWPLTGPFVPGFFIDSLNLIFIIMAALLWFAVSLYSYRYMKVEGRSRGFNIASLLTLVAVMGVFLARNLLTMLLFFELMTISSYFWVIHRRDKEAIRAGYFYLFFSIIGGLFLVLGIVFMGAATDVLPAIGSGAVTPLNARAFNWSMVFFLIGFGIKAGMVPLHLWLPHAHSAAPAPASGLISGLLIKVGAYGLIRLGEFAGWGMGAGVNLKFLGVILLITGILSMLLGVVAALLQSDAKRLLAYHSVSQMGYIILGLGISLYLGAEGVLGLLGAIYHVLNHALFKAALFLGVGIIYVYRKETDLYKLGGLWRQYPVTAILMFFAVLGITGAPGLNGYASKTLLHHAVSFLSDKGGLWAVWLEWLFSLVGVGTTASFSKLYYLMFLAKPAEEDGIERLVNKKFVTERKLSGMQAAMVLLVISMVLLGLFPQFFLYKMAVPAAETLGLSAETALAGFSFWTFSDLAGIFITLALGVLVCFAGLKSGAFHWQPPQWLTLEGLGNLAFGELSLFWGEALEFYHFACRGIADTGKNLAGSLVRALRRFEEPGSLTAGKSTFTGISADLFLVFMVLAILLILFTLTRPELLDLSILANLSGN